MLDGIRRMRPAARRSLSGLHTVEVNIEMLHDGARRVPVALQVPPEEPEELRDERLVRELALLPPKWRLAVELRYFRDMDAPEVARTLGVCESRVSQILSGALGRLRHALCAPDDGLAA